MTQTQTNKDNVELLTYIYQNAEMGVYSIRELNNELKDEKLKEFLQGQLKEYNAIYDEADEILKEMGCESKEPSDMSKMMNKMVLKMQTMTDHSTTHIAAMMIKGSTNGVIEIIQKLNDFRDVDEKVKNLANKLLKHEEKNIDELKKLL